jgi:glycosyltransferase involved in cell wall biosynthesis
LENELRSKAKQLGVRAVFEGFKNQSELPLYYVGADVVVLPSGETWGLVVNEGMACGLPAIVSNAAGCLPDMIEEDRTGYSFPFGDAKALTDRLRRVADKTKWGHDWRPALEAKLTTYSVETAIAGTMDAINALARTPTLPSS